MKYLFTSSVGNPCKRFLKKIIKRFGYEDFDYIICVYDDTEFNEKIFKYCKIIYKKEYQWNFLAQYVTPGVCKKYEYIFTWADDLDIENFSYKNFIKIMKQNKLYMAQPALTHKSYYSHIITLKDQNYKIGRFTDFVEIMAPVFSREAYPHFWKMISENFSRFGWGYDILAESLCGYKRMGIIDCETITHKKPVQSHKTEAPSDMARMLKKYSSFKCSQKIIYGPLK